MAKPKSKAPLPVIGPVDDPQSLYHQMRQYLEWQRVRNYSGRTIENRENNLRLFITWCDERGVTQPQEVTRPPSWVTTLASMEAKPESSSTIRQEKFFCLLMKFGSS